MQTLHTGTVGVVGGGIMGSGIAEVTARAGFDVLAREVDTDAARAARNRVASSLARAVRSGRVSDTEREATPARVDLTCDLGDLAGCDVVVEAVVEDEAEKIAIFRALGGIVAPHLFLRMVEAGLLGRKSGRGFFSHDPLRATA